ncbi:hypothetical protein ACFSZS_26200 [Seohaeicola zhoushanensis]
MTSEAEYKRRMAAEGRIMQHAHIGFRNMDRTVGAIREIQETAAAEGVKVDRFGITLDWTMGYPPDRRDAAQRGTGIVLDGPEDFARITNASPAASHFGDFMLGMPGALHNVQAALAAGRPPSATSASISPSACPIGTTTSPPPRPPSPPSA